MIEIGNKLQEARNAKKLSLEALHERTKINVSILRDIEAGRAENLPEAYYRAFIRTIAKEVMEKDGLGCGCVSVIGSLGCFDRATQPSIGIENGAFRFDRPEVRFRR